MSTILMIRKCQHCGHKYCYNPCTGNFGIVCPKCNKPQFTIVPSPDSEFIK